MADQLTEDDVVVVLFHDHGSRYVGKMFNDDWMRERGFLEEEVTTAGKLVGNRGDQPLVTLYAEELVSHAIDKMRRNSISQIPVLRNGKFEGSLDDTHLYHALLENPSLMKTPISQLMDKPFPMVKEDSKIEDISKLISKEVPAVLVELKNGNHHIITRHDLIAAIAK